MQGRLTVYYDGQFWVGVFERTEDGQIQATRVIFGPEPREQEVYAFVLENYLRLPFGKALTADPEAERRINPKRLQRRVRSEMLEHGAGTKAQQAVKAAQEARKEERRIIGRADRLAEEKRRFTLRQEKKKARHKGH